VCNFQTTGSANVHLRVNFLKKQVFVLAMRESVHIPKFHPSLLQPGHLKVDCPSAPVKENGVLTKACHSCGDVGHLKRDCPKVSPTDLLCSYIPAEAVGRRYRGFEEVLAIR
jgi:hypothetical protein